MRTLFAVAVLLAVSSSQLTAQVIVPPAPRGQTARGQAAPAPPARGQAARGQAPEGTGVYLVTFRPGTPASDRAAAMQAAGARLRNAYDATNAASVDLPDASALARLRNDPQIGRAHV